jgi:hypothetical protein
MEYHRDKNGKEIRRVDVVIHDSGVKLEPFGTGVIIPPFDSTMTFWRPDEWKTDDPYELPVVFVNTNEVSIDIPIFPKLSLREAWKGFWKWFLTGV